jgi:hypothetical protein
LNFFYKLISLKKQLSSRKEDKNASSKQVALSSNVSSMKQNETPQEQKSFFWNK